jgi:hypothetical protein
MRGEETGSGALPRREYHKVQGRTHQEGSGCAARAGEGAKSRGEGSAWTARPQRGFSARGGVGRPKCTRDKLHALRVEHIPSTSTSILQDAHRPRRRPRGARRRHRAVSLVRAPPSRRSLLSPATPGGARDPSLPRSKTSARPLRASLTPRAPHSPPSRFSFSSAPSPSGRPSTESPTRPRRSVSYISRVGQLRWGSEFPPGGGASAPRAARRGAATGLSPPWAHSG